MWYVSWYQLKATAVNSNFQQERTYSRCGFCEAGVTARRRKALPLRDVSKNERHVNRSL